MMFQPMTRNHIAASATMKRPLDEREAELKAGLQRLKEQRKALKEDMKRLKKKIKGLKDSTFNQPQAQDDDQDDNKDDDQD
jgi:predicted RNase H-like nuclease (RuvC/YqgF family)